MSLGIEHSRRFAEAKGVFGALQAFRDDSWMLELQSAMGVQADQLITDEGFERAMEPEIQKARPISSN
jgi:hypothetical protein